MAIAIQARDIDKHIGNGAGRLNILSGLQLQIERGESVAILGRSGAGKTTLLSLLAGLDQPSAGRIELAGQDITAMNEEQRAALRAGRVGFVFQSFQLLDGFDAQENVRLAAELAGLDQPKHRAERALIQVGLGARRQHYPRQLSGGEKQRVALARAFAGEPQILFADEPTGNLDGETGATIIELLFQMNQDRDTTLVLVTHDEQLAKRCDRQLRLAHGALEAL